MTRDALIEGPYRYWLSRFWDAGCGTCVWVMLNPSTADGQEDDPTIRRCVGFSKAWGFSGLVVVNLYAWRSVSPSELKRELARGDVVGPRNDAHITLQVALADRVILAWGGQPLSQHRADHVEGIAREWGDEEPECLGITKTGNPRHPLYVKASTEPRLL